MIAKNNNLFAFISRYRWPIMLAGLLLLSITAQGIMVLLATSSTAPQPEKDFYENSLKWDETRALSESSKALGWKLDISLPEGAQYVHGMARPVDLVIQDNDGKPVTGLTGDLHAIRPAETRMNTSGKLTEIPYDKGHYRTLIVFKADGLWELAVDAWLGKQRYVARERIDVKVAKP